MGISQLRGTMDFESTLPDPENHPFFTEPDLDSDLEKPGIFGRFFGKLYNLMNFR